MELITPRLVLRRVRREDLAAMHTVLSDPRAMRFWSTLPHATLAETERWFESLLRPAGPDNDEFVIVREGVVIGKIGMWQAPEIGFILHPDHWGQNFASEAGAAFVRHIFGAYPIDTLTADVDPRNAGSVGVLKKLGFGEVGRAQNTFCIGGEWSDSIYLELRRPK